MPVGRDEKYFGYDGFIWFIGVVEDLNDPEKVSRVRVRVLGHHDEDKKVIKTEDLPWAQVMMPTTSASISGIGNSPHGLVNGSYVFGFFMDGEYAQQPVVIGTWHGIPQALANAEKGFNDPDGVYPTEVDEPDTNKLARGENTIDDIIDLAINNPPSAYAAEYPHNKVFQTTSGHIFEIDDTPEAERIRIYHRSGTMQEIYPNGDKVEIRSNNWQMTYGNDKARVSGNLELYVDGNAQIEVGENASVTVDKNADIRVGLNATALVGENFDGEIGGNSTTLIRGNLDATVDGNVTSFVGGNVNQTVKGNVKGLVEGSVTLDISKSATVTVPETTWTGNITLGGNLTQTGSYNLTGTATATGDFVSAGISGKGHTHLAGSPPGSTGTPQ